MTEEGPRAPPGGQHDRPRHARRLPDSGGPGTDKALEEILFRAPHGAIQSLAPYPPTVQGQQTPEVVGAEAP